MIEKVLDVLIIDAGLISAYLAVCIVRNIRRYRRLHHPKDNKRFMAHYRAARPQDSRTTEAPPTTSTPQVRHRPADAGQRRPRPPASAGPQWSQP